jgi:large subunit ribosomal protein L22
MSKPVSPRKVGDKEALAVGTTIRGSAQKLNLVAALIRNRKAGDAMNILQFSTKGMAVEVRKILASAIAKQASASRFR